MLSVKIRAARKTSAETVFVFVSTNFAKKKVVIWLFMDPIEDTDGVEAIFRVRRLLQKNIVLRNAAQTAIEGREKAEAQLAECRSQINRLRLILLNEAECRLCGTAMRRTNYRQHMLRQHSNIPFIYCCMDVYISAQELNEHYLTCALAENMRPAFPRA